MAAVSVTAEGTRHRIFRELDRECQVRAIAVWYRILGVLGALGGVLAVILGVEVRGPLGSMVGVALTGLSVGVYALGSAMFRYVAFARWVGVGVAIAGLGGSALALVGETGVPVLVNVALVGWNLAVLYVLASSATTLICNDGYREKVSLDATTKVRWWTSRFFSVPVVLVVIQLLVLGATFTVTE